MATTGRNLFQLGFQISPIILTGGIAALIPGGMLPLIAITQAGIFAQGLLSGTVNLNLDDFQCHFHPMQGSTLVNQSIGSYPFASQSVAANAVIAQPLQLSMLMEVPVNQSGGYLSKFLTMTALKAALDKHNQSGGTYTIATPSYVYTNCIMRTLRDVTGDATKHPQQTWQFDFERPLVVTQTEAEQVLNNLMSKFNAGTQINGQPTWSGLFNSVQATVVGGASSLISGAQNLIGTNTGSLL
jgi:hypothetical protein